MESELRTVLDAAMRLPSEQRAELMRSLSIVESEKNRGRGGDVTKYFGIFDSGDPDSANNEKIDADLAREYADTHDYEN